MDPNLRTYYYYDRDDNNHIETTYCFITDGHQWARGAALRAPTDNPSKATGRKIAYSRAMNAYHRKNTKQGSDPTGDRIFWKEVFRPNLRPLEVRFMAIK